MRIWLCDLTYTSEDAGLSSETFPLGIGQIGSYLLADQPQHSVRIAKQISDIAAAVDTEQPDIVGLSNYNWNAYLSLGVANILKERWPRVTVVFGGPNYSLDPDARLDFLRHHSVIDYYVRGEGEVAFAALVRMAARGQLAARRREAARLPSVDYLLHQGRDQVLVSGETLARVPSLDHTPSPYLTGLLDPFFGAGLVPTIETNRGCPFSCTFCVEGRKYYSKIAFSREDTVRAELHYIGRRMKEALSRGDRNELIIADSNFGMYAPDRSTCEQIAECQDLYGWPKYVNVTTGKNRRDRVVETVQLARGAIQLVGAVQSLDPQVLENVQRKNVDVQALMDIGLRARAGGVVAKSDVILGLPGDSYQSHVETVRSLIFAGFDRISLFQYSLLPGSESEVPSARAGITTAFRVSPQMLRHGESTG